MYKVNGIIKYNPKRNVSSKWWLTVDLYNFGDTAKYYRWLLDKNWWEYESRSYKRKYHKPPHTYHISIIRGERPRKNIDDWGKFKANEKVSLLYENLLKQTTLYRDNDDTFFFLDTYYDMYCDFREHFGLDYQRGGKDFRGHITIARAS